MLVPASWHYPSLQRTFTFIQPTNIYSKSGSVSNHLQEGASFPLHPEFLPTGIYPVIEFYLLIDLISFNKGKRFLGKAQ